MQRDVKQVQVQGTTHRLLKEVTKKAAKVTKLPTTQGRAIHLALENYSRVLDEMLEKK